MKVWMVYLGLIALALPAVLLWKLNAAIVAGVMIAAAVAVNLLMGERLCRDCGNQWRAG